MYASILTYLQENTGDYLGLVLQHLKISGLSVMAAVMAGIPLGILSSKALGWYNFFSGFFGLLRVIPSLAVLLICIPIMGIGTAPSVTALTLLAIPPVLVNTALGFRNLPPAVLETALGMGMGKGRIFLTVKLPLAMPLILTGIRTSAVEVIASATLAAYIGAGGLGTLILTGLGLYRMDLLLVGGLSVAVISLAVDMMFHLLERGIVSYRQK